MYTIDEPTKRLIADVLNPVRGPHNVSRAELRHAVAAQQNRIEALELYIQVERVL